MSVELTLWPGLPVIQFMGLPDQSIRESALRIKSAIRAQGFEFPKTHQILVNLRPSYLKKTSKGLELAVALAYLLETQQIQDVDEFSENEFSAYGELTLGGRVVAPDDYGSLLSQLRGSKAKILGGSAQTAGTVADRVFCVENLADLREQRLTAAMPVLRKPKQRPALVGENLWSSQEAQLLAILAAGGHSGLLAGPSGLGKTTLAQSVHRLLPEPEDSSENPWVPFVSPHHSIPVASLIGGGAALKPGELTRANGGIFMLDEFLEFQSVVLESLRQPMQEGVVRVARSGRAIELPCHAQFLATTNLCPCGQWAPGRPKPFCRFRQSKCRSYASRFSGPLLDRFELIQIMDSHAVKRRSIGENDILTRVLAATEFRLQKRNQRLKNAKVNFLELESEIPKSRLAQSLPSQMGSVRRTRATIRVARTLADLDLNLNVEAQHLEQALAWTHRSFIELMNWD